MGETHLCRDHVYVGTLPVAPNLLPLVPLQYYVGCEPDAAAVSPQTGSGERERDSTPMFDTQVSSCVESYHFHHFSQFLFWRFQTNKVFPLSTASTIYIYNSLTSCSIFSESVTGRLARERVLRVPLRMAFISLRSMNPSWSTLSP